MSAEPAIRHNPDSFIEALRHEQVAGTESLSAWITGLQAGGAIEELFQLETWLKSLRSFFDLRHLPMEDPERAGILQRNFSAEIRVACRAVEIAERCASELIRHGQSDLVTFEKFIELHLRRGNSTDYQVRKALDQPTPADSLSRLLESLNDFRIMFEALGRDRVSAQLFLTCGRSFRRDLKNCRHVDMLLTQRFRVEYDQVPNAAAASALRGIPDERIRRDVTIALLHAHRLLHYLKVVAQELGSDRPVRHALVVFSLLHDESVQLCDHLRRLQRKREATPAFRHCSEFLAYSLSLEAKRLTARFLAGISREPDMAAVHANLESGHELLRNCLQNCVISLLQACDPNLDPHMIIPTLAERVWESEKVRLDLWKLRQLVKNLLDRREELESHQIVEQIATLGEAALRFLTAREWEEFERFSDAVITVSDRSEIRTLMRNFTLTIEALIGEISLRNVTQ
jgi:hypothetical protein